jgi:hypothetical protein
MPPVVVLPADPAPPPAVAAAAVRQPIVQPTQLPPTRIADRRDSQPYLLDVQEDEFFILGEHWWFGDELRMKEPSRDKVIRMVNEKRGFRGESNGEGTIDDGCINYPCTSVGLRVQFDICGPLRR